MLMAAGALTLVLAAGSDRAPTGALTAWPIGRSSGALANVGEPTEAPLADLSLLRDARTTDAADHPRQEGSTERRVERTNGAANMTQNLGRNGARFRRPRRIRAFEASTTVRLRALTSTSADRIRQRRRN